MQKVVLFVSFLAVMLPASTSRAQQLPVDTTTVDVRLPEEERINTYRSDKAFQYETDIQSSDSWMLRFLGWLSKQLDRIFRSSYGIISGRIILLILFVIALGLLLNAFFKGNLDAAFTGRSASKKLKINLHEEHIDSVDLDKLMNEAVQKQNYQLAARYLYLKVLQVLNEYEVISWANDKTNHEYLEEITNSPLKKSFNTLTFIHDYAEYGNFNISPDRFAAMQKSYSVLLSLLENTHE